MLTEDPTGFVQSPDSFLFIRTTLVNVIVDLVVFTRIAGTSQPEVADIGVNTI